MDGELGRGKRTVKLRREEGFIYEQDYINGTVRRRTEIEGRIPGKK